MNVSLWERYLAAERELNAAVEAAGRRRDEVRLLPVSKTVSAEKIMELYTRGIRCFGENRAAVLTEKAAILPPDIEWHFIGPLQSNKVRKVVRSAAMVHSVGDAEILSRLDRVAGEEIKQTAFLLEVNISGEESKGGVSLAQLDDLAELADGCRYAVWRGLMTMAPLGAPETELRGIFGSLARERDRLELRFGRKLPVLSMGMSGDYRIAVECGATMVRLGTCIFGCGGIEQ